jgi:hypothetical protein
MRLTYLLRLTAATMFAAMSVPALAQDWRLVGSNNGMTDFIDVSTVRRTGPSVRFWTERRLDAPLAVSDRLNIDLVSELYEADCDALTYAPVQRAAYLSRRLVIPSYRPDEPMMTARPGTVIALLIRFACAN